MRTALRSASASVAQVPPAPAVSSSVRVRVTRIRKIARVDAETQYAEKEYGVTKEELAAFSKRVHGQIKKAKQEGKLVEFTGEF